MKRLSLVFGIVLLLLVMLPGCMMPVMVERGAALDRSSVDARGHVRLTGPHVDLHPFYYVKVAGQWVKHPVSLAQPMRLSSTTTATTVTPALPSDYGATVDASGKPLFMAPDADDVNQNQADDCYLLATWDSIVRENPQYAGAILYRNLQGQNCLTFRRVLSAPVTVVMDSRISSGQWAHPSPTTGAISGCIVEKGYFYFRTGANTAASSNYGFSGSVMTDFGISNLTVNAAAPGGVAAIIATLANHLPCVGSSLSSIPAGIPIVAGHAYTVVSANALNLTLRNPWGCDGANYVIGGVNINPSATGSQVTLTWAQAGKAFASFSCGTAYATIAPVTPPAPVATTITIKPDDYSAIYKCQVESNNGLRDIGYVQPGAGSWVEFPIKGAVAGKYMLSAQMAGYSAGTSIVTINGVGVAPALVTPATGSWAKFSAATLSVSLPAGDSALRFTGVGNSQYNLANITLTPAGVTP